MLTATLFGVPGMGRVVVGPLKQHSDSSRIFHVSSGMKLGPLPLFSHHSAPASHGTYSALDPLAFSTKRAASTSSGPVPSPLMSAIFMRGARILAAAHKCFPPTDRSGSPSGPAELPAVSRSGRQRG